MSNKDILCARIDETISKVKKFEGTKSTINFPNISEIDITKEWLLAGEEILKDIDKKCDEFSAYCRVFYKSARNEIARRKREEYKQFMNKELSNIADELAGNISELIKSRSWRANVSKEEMAETNVLMLSIAKSIEKLRRLAE